MAFPISSDCSLPERVGNWWDQILISFQSVSHQAVLAVKYPRTVLTSHSRINCFIQQPEPRSSKPCTSLTAQSASIIITWQTQYKLNSPFKSPKWQKIPVLLLYTVVTSPHTAQRAACCTKPFRTGRDPGPGLDSKSWTMQNYTNMFRLILIERGVSGRYSCLTHIFLWPIV